MLVWVNVCVFWETVPVSLHYVCIGGSASRLSWTSEPDWFLENWSCSFIQEEQDLRKEDFLWERWLRSSGFTGFSSRMCPPVQLLQSSVIMSLPLKDSAANFVTSLCTVLSADGWLHIINWRFICWILERKLHLHHSKLESHWEVCLFL